MKINTKDNHKPGINRSIKYLSPQREISKAPVLVCPLDMLCNLFLAHPKFGRAAEVRGRMRRDYIQAAAGRDRALYQLRQGPEGAKRVLLQEVLQRGHDLVVESRRLRMNEPFGAN